MEDTGMTDYLAEITRLECAVDHLDKGNRDLAIKYIASAVEFLGYRLVPIQTPAEAHEAALKRFFDMDRDYGQQDISGGR
jgi:3-methyladenine DNA glycosylase/8-oxoguanine DNA glycosylase